LYPNKKIIACFQPHLFSRTKDFIDGFAESLSQFDEILLLEIYPARELPMEGVNSSWLLSKIKNKNKRLVTKEELLTSFATSDANVFVTIGAGDIGEMVKDVKKVLNEKV
jgi:UDP-N-acetylmuramate--alanine ligase